MNWFSPQDPDLSNIYSILNLYLFQPRCFVRRGFGFEESVSVLHACAQNSWLWAVTRGDETILWVKGSSTTCIDTALALQTTIEEVNVGISLKSHLFACNSPNRCTHTDGRERESIVVGKYTYIYSFFLLLLILISTYSLHLSLYIVFVIDWLYIYIYI